MNLDIRVPMGMLFTILGALLSVYGAASDHSIYSRSLGYNVNLDWGLFLLVAGIVTLIFGRRGQSTVRRAEATPEGRATEMREHDTGLESETPRQH